MYLSDNHLLTMLEQIYRQYWRVAVRINTRLVQFRILAKSCPSNCHRSNERLVGHMIFAYLHEGRKVKFSGCFTALTIPNFLSIHPNVKR